MTHQGSSAPSSQLDVSASYQVAVEHGMQFSPETGLRYIDGLQEGIAVFDRDLLCRAWNPFLERLTGIPRTHALGRPAAETCALLAGDAGSSAMRAALLGQGGRAEARHWLDGAGTPCWLAPEFLPLPGIGGGGVAGVVVHVRDVTERMEQQRKIDRLTRIAEVLGSINAAIVRIRDRQTLMQEACRIAVTHGAFLTAWIGLLDPATGEGHIAAASGGTRDYFDRVGLSIHPDAPSSGRPANIAMRTRRPVICNDIATYPAFAPVRDELLAKHHRSVTAFPLIAEGRVLGALSLFADSVGFFDEPEMKLLNQLAGDISFGLEHILKDERLHYLAYYDPVTALPNRNFFIEKLGKELQTADRKVDRLVLCVGDVRRLGGINDTFGRVAGDSVLREFAQRLAPHLRNPESLAYLGNGRFASTVGEVDPADLAFRIEQNVRMSAEPFVVDGVSIATTAAVGVAIYPDDGTTAEALLRGAEAALAQAKLANVPYLFYKASLNGQVADELRLESSLRRALERDEFVLHYQPKVGSADGTVVGVEALLRWNDPERGLVYPDQFIPVLESSGLIVDVGRWVIARALADFHACRAAGQPMPRIAVNVSVKHLQHERFMADLRELAARDGGIGEALELEITESMVMENIDRQIGTLSAIKAMGIRVAIDDFGTGYSSLSYLAKLPIDTLKVDRSFILSMIDDPASMTIVSSIVSLAHSLGLAVVAEGVETEGHAAVLRRLGCDEMQGYLFSRPLPLAGLLELIG